MKLTVHAAFTEKDYQYFGELMHPYALYEGSSAFFSPFFFFSFPVVYEV